MCVIIVIMIRTLPLIIITIGYISAVAGLLRPGAFAGSSAHKTAAQKIPCTTCDILYTL